MDIFGLGLDKLLNKTSPVVSNSLEALAAGTVQSLVPENEPSPATESPVTASVPSERVMSGDISEIIFSQKRSFTDTVEGWRQGLDPLDKRYKWVIGGPNSQIDFSVTRAGVLSFTVSNNPGTSNAIFIDDASPSPYPALDIRRSVGTGSGIYVEIASPSGYGLDILQHSNTAGIHVITDGVGSSVVPVQLQNNTAVSTNYWEVAEYRGGSAPAVSVSQWVGTANPNGVLDGSFGDILQSEEGKLYVNIDDSTGWQDLTDDPSITTLVAGKPIPAGAPVSVESDGLAWPTTMQRATGVVGGSTQALENDASRRSIALDASDTIKCFFSVNDSTPDIIEVTRVTVDPTTGSYVSHAKSTITTPTVSVDIVEQHDAKLLTTNKVVLVWMDRDSVSATSFLNAKIIDFSSGSAVQGTTFVVASGTGTFNSGLAVSVDSSTGFLVWYQDGTTGIDARYCMVSGTTITGGTTTQITSETADTVFGADAWSGTNHHIVAYDNVSGAARYVRCVSNAAGTLTQGSSVSLGLHTYTVSPSCGPAVFAELNSTMMANYSTKLNTSDWDMYERVITRSGTTLTVRQSTGVMANDWYDIDGSAYQATPLGNMDVMLTAHSYQETGTIVGFIRYLSSAAPNGTLIDANTEIVNGANFNPCGASVTVSPTRILTFSGLTSTSMSIDISDVQTTDSAMIGIARVDAAKDATASIKTSGRLSAFTGLTPGTPYYGYPAGGRTTTRTFEAKKLGVAASATDLIIQI